MPQEQLKALMYVDRSLRGDPNKYMLTDKLKFKNCVRLKEKTTSKFFVGITKKRFMIHHDVFDAKNIFSQSFIQNLKQKPNMFQNLSIKINISLLKQR